MNLRDVIPLLKRTDVHWTLVPILAAAGLCFVPGFDVLSFYFCLPMALLLAMAAGSVVITGANRGRARGDLASGLRTGIRHALLLPLPPLVVITIAHFVNGPCDYLYGLNHYLAGPVMSTLTGAGVAASCAVAFRKETTASRAYIAVFVASFIPAAWTLYFEPSVSFFNPFLGYYPGPIYDELIEVTPAYLTFRAWCLLAVAALWTTVRLVRGRSGELPARRNAATWAIVAGLWALCLLTVHGYGDFRFNVNRSDIRAELSFQRSDRWCRIYADKSYEKRGNLADDLLRDCGYRHRQMASFFHVAAWPPVEVYLYRDAEQKGRMMGARHVEVSKPWLNEVHVSGMLPGDMVLGHEIAHVAAGRLSYNLLSMPLEWLVVPNMGMVEGLAVAAAFADEGPSPHEWALAMMRSGMAVDPASLFSPLSFVSGGAAASYNTAGSFIRFIHDRYGSNSVGMLAAGDSFEEATGRTMRELDLEWRTFLIRDNAANMDDVLKMRAAARFSDPGVLYRRCPLDVARRLRDAFVLYDTGNPDAALDKVREAVDLDPEERGLKRLAARLEFTVSHGIGDADRFDRIIEDVMSPPRGAATMADRTAAADLLILRGFSDVDYARSHAFLERAESELRDLRAMLTPGGAMRAICARLSALRLPGEAGTAVIEALADPRPWSEGDAGRLISIADRYPEAAVLWYLAGRAAMQEGLYPLAQAAFDKARTAGFTEPVPVGTGAAPAAGTCSEDFAAENLKLLGTAAFWAGDTKTASAALREASGKARFDGDRMVIAEYLERMAGR